MTREEQINKAALDNSQGTEFGLIQDVEIDSFIKGAEWADEHPKSLLIKLEDKMPEEGQLILVFHKVTSSLKGISETQISPMICRYTKGLLDREINRGYMDVLCDSEFIYWMPLDLDKLL